MTRSVPLEGRRPQIFRAFLFVCFVVLTLGGETNAQRLFTHPCRVFRCLHPRPRGRTNRIPRKRERRGLDQVGDQLGHQPRERVSGRMWDSFEARPLHGGAVTESRAFRGFRVQTPALYPSSIGNAWLGTSPGIKFAFTGPGLRTESAFKTQDSGQKLLYLSPPS